VSEGQQMQLNASGWFIEQEKKTEELLNHMRHTRGTFHTDSCKTFAWYEGYKAGITAMYRKFEDDKIVSRHARVEK
jgi:hypothetical protein